MHVVDVIFMQRHPQSDSSSDNNIQAATAAVIAFLQQ